MAEERQLLGKNRPKMIEKVENRGTFRIVGQVYESKERCRRVLGYGIIDVKNCTLKLMTVKQTTELLKRYKFENAILDSITGEIINTECSMSRLIQFDTKQNVIGNAGVTILGQIFVNGKYDGYRILNEKGKVLDVTEATLLQVTENGTKLPILNAKVVSREGSTEKFVSAIKGEFKKIEKSEFDKMVSEMHPSGKSIKELHDRYRERVVSRIINNVAKYGSFNLPSTVKNKKDVKIFIEEFVIPTYGEKYKETSLGVSDVVTLYALAEICKKRYSHFTSRIATNIESVKKSDRVFAERQPHRVFLLRKPYPREAIELAKANLDEDVAIFMEEVLRVYNGELREIDLSKSLISSMGLRYLAKRFINKTVKRASALNKPTYNTRDLDFESTEGIKQLGYTIKNDEVGTSFNSVIYGNIKLRHLRSLLSYYDRCGVDTNEILDNINCFGDVELMHKCAKIENETVLDEAIKLKTQAYAFVLAVNNPYLANIVSKHVLKHYPDLELPINEISREKFKLDADDDLFYKSGGKFNRVATLRKGESWSIPDDNKGSLSNFTGGYFAALSLYLTIDGFAERGLIDNN